LKKDYITENGHKSLFNELKNILIEHKDLSIQINNQFQENSSMEENNGLQILLEENSKIEKRIKYIRSNLENNILILKKDVNLNVISVGSKCILENEDNELFEEYEIVGSCETDPVNGKISHLSPLGKSLLNKSKGEEIDFSIGEIEKNYIVRDIILPE